MKLSDIKVVDMNESIVDKEKSDPDNGFYEFDKKVYVKDLLHSGQIPDYHFSWCRYDADTKYRDVREWQVKFKFSFVKYPEDPYWPEGVPPNGEGVYEFGDVVLMKCALRDFLIKRAEEIEQSESAAKAKLAKFQGDALRAGVGISREMLSELAGINVAEKQKKGL